MSDKMNPVHVGLILFGISFLSVTFLIYVIIKNKRIRGVLIEDPYSSPMTQTDNDTLPSDSHLPQSLTFPLTINLLNKIIIRENTFLHFLTSSTTQAESPIPKSPYFKLYFEVKLIQLPSTTTMYLGIAPKDTSGINRPGKIPFSIGYESRTGSVNINCDKKYENINYGRPLSEGDILGMGYFPFSKFIYFTKNGQFYRSLKFPISKPLHNDFYITIHADGPCQLNINDGSEPFVYSIANINSEFTCQLQNHQCPPAYIHPPPI